MNPALVPYHFKIVTMQQLSCKILIVKKEINNKIYYTIYEGHSLINSRIRAEIGILPPIILKF